VVSGEDLLVRFAPNLWPLCTKARAYGSYPLAEVYGLTPVVADTDGRGIPGWYPVCVPLRIHLTLEEAEALGIALPGAKRGRVMPMYPPHNLPGLEGSVEWHAVLGGTVRDVAERLGRVLKPSFPYFWSYFVPALPLVFTTVTVDCKYVPHWLLWKRRGEEVWDRARRAGRPEEFGLHESFLALGEHVASLCSSADYRTIGAQAKGVLASQYTVLYPHVLTLLINGPLINAFYWRVMYDVYETGDKSAVVQIRRVAGAVQGLREQELGALVSGEQVPAHNINQHVLHGVRPAGVRQDQSAGQHREAGVARRVRLGPALAQLGAGRREGGGQRLATLRHEGVAVHTGGSAHHNNHGL